MKKQVDISLILSNPNNPRIIKDHKFDKLVKSIKEFPQMLEKRPVVVDEEMMVLGGNMRLKACREAGIKKVWIDVADGWTDKQKKEFTIKDNVGFGEWDWDILANDWETKSINDWGLDIWQPEQEVDYSVLDDINLDEEIDSMYQQTKKSIILEYSAEGFEPIKALYDKLKGNDTDLSNLFYEAMKKSDT